MTHGAALRCHRPPGAGVCLFYTCFFIRSFVFILPVRRNRLIVNIT